jgi:hypothetical protein
MGLRLVVLLVGVLGIFGVPKTAHGAPVRGGDAS